MITLGFPKIAFSRIKNLSALAVGEPRQNPRGLWVELWRVRRKRKIVPFFSLRYFFIE
jgi:hypothetical protein